jgi:hypothetical protein
MQAPVWESIVLGAIQGLTEFLPISSDGHLALTEMLFKFSSKGLALNVMLHVGTLVATIVMLWPRFRPALFDGLAACAKPSLFVTAPGARDALVVILASIPTAALGLGLRHSVERWTESPLAVGLGFLGTSAVLIASGFAKEGQDEQPGIVGALLIGVAQGLAVLPGLSQRLDHHAGAFFGRTPRASLRAIDADVRTGSARRDPARGAASLRRLLAARTGRGRSRGCVFRRPFGLGFTAPRRAGRSVLVVRGVGGPGGARYLGARQGLAPRLMRD